MIVKKLYKKVKCKEWDRERKVFQNITTKDYLGWFLFDIIPIYLIQLSKYEELNYTEHEEKCVLEYGIYKTYGHLIRK